MNGPTLLVPVRVPLTDGGEQTVRQAVDFATDFDRAHLFFLHVNLQYKDESVTRPQFQGHIEEIVGQLSDASYHVRNTFFLEVAILEEASLQDVDYVIIGHSRRKRWLQWLRHRFGLAVDLESVLGQRLDAELVVV